MIPCNFNTFSFPIKFGFTCKSLSSLFPLFPPSLILFLTFFVSQCFFFVFHCFYFLYSFLNSHFLCFIFCVIVPFVSFCSLRQASLILSNSHLTLFYLFFSLFRVSRLDT